MKTLYLMRHATCPYAPQLDDMKRPLSDHGAQEAFQMGAFLSKPDIAIGSILCSSAVRTRQTADQLLKAFDAQTADLITYHDSLYLGAPGDYLDLLQRHDSPTDSILVIGHNPTIPALAAMLCDSDQIDDKLYRALTSNYRPAMITQLEFRINAWADIAPYLGMLRAIHAPK